MAKIELTHYSNNPEWIKGMQQDTTFEQRKALFLQGCQRLFKENVQGETRDHVRALMFGIEKSWVTDPDLTVREKAEADFQKVRTAILAKEDS